jgi:predicted peptidase
MYKRTIYLLLISIISFATSNMAKAQALPQYDKGMYLAKGDTLPYRILFPVNFDPTQKYPLIIILHDSQLCGNDNEAQLKHGGSFFQKASVREKYPAIVVFPQCPKTDSWSDVTKQTETGVNRFTFPTDEHPTKALLALTGLINEFLEKPYVNAHHIYIGGIEMGGMGTFELIAREPKLFAAAFPIGGGDNTLNAKKYAKKVPVWIFHGEKDKMVLADHSIVMAEAIKQAGGDPKFTLLTDDGFACWNHALTQPDFMPWLFANSK